jgi:KaiC/GvpD/RAD55 family RecA-like ATPase
MVQSKLQQFKERIQPILILLIRKHLGVIGFSLFMATGFISILSWYYYRAWRREKNRIPNIVARFFSRDSVSDDFEEYFYFNRPEEERKIQPILNNLPSGLFYLVTSLEGTGKTSIVKHCARASEGVLYFSVPSDPKDFSTQFAKAINYDMTPANIIEEYLSRFRLILPDVHQSTVLNMTLSALSNACAYYKQYYLYSPTLIIDNFSTLAHDPHTFDRLVSFAKEEADAKRLTIIFVASTSPIDIVRKISERSRLEIIEIGDLNRENAKRFFNLYVTDVSSDEVVEVTGGRMIQLVKAVDMFRKERVHSIEEMKMRFLDESYNKLVETNLIIPPKKMEKDPDHPVLPRYLQNGVTTLMKIYDSPTKSITYRELIHDLGDTSSLLLFNGKIFFRSHAKNQVFLESKSLELCVGEMMGERDTHRRREFADIFLPPPNE